MESGSGRCHGPVPRQQPRRRAAAAGRPARPGPGPGRARHYPTGSVWAAPAAAAGLIMSRVALAGTDTLPELDLNLKVHGGPRLVRATEAAAAPGRRRYRGQVLGAAARLGRRPPPPGFPPAAAAPGPRAGPLPAHGAGAGLSLCPSQWQAESDSEPDSVWVDSISRLPLAVARFHLKSPAEFQLER